LHFCEYSPWGPRAIALCSRNLRWGSTVEMGGLGGEEKRRTMLEVPLRSLSSQFKQYIKA
jgi:hypothetical protein